MNIEKARAISLIESVILEKLDEVGQCARSEVRGRMEEIDALTAALEAYRKATDWNQSRKIILPMTLPGLNDYITAERSHRQSGAAMKRKWQRDVALVMRRQLRRPLRISTHAPTPGATAKTTKKQGCFHKKQTIFTSIILCLFLVVKCSMRFLENHLKNLVRGCRTFLFA